MPTRAEITQVAPRTWFVKPGFVNVAIFETDEGLVMVDAGFATDGAAIHEAVRSVTAENSLTGMLMRPKLIDPLQMARGTVRSFTRPPVGDLPSIGRSKGGIQHSEQRRPPTGATSGERRSRCAASRSATRLRAQALASTARATRSVPKAVRIAR